MSKFVSSFTLAEVTAAERTSARALGTSSRPGLQLVIKAASTITPAASRQLIVLFMYRYIRNFNYSSGISIILQDFNYSSGFQRFQRFQLQILKFVLFLFFSSGLEPRVMPRLGPRAWAEGFAGGLSRGLGPRAWPGFCK